MSMRTFGFGLLAVLAIAFTGGCNKSNEPAASTVTPRSSTPDTRPPSARIHWLGKKRLAADRNAASLMSAWGLPESAKLEAQTLDKLALALAGAGQPPAATNSPIHQPTNYQALVAANLAASLLRPLLDDLVEEESCVELRQAATNQPGEIALAIRLSDSRAAFWSKNLTAATNALHASRSTLGALRVSFGRSAGWTVVTLIPPSAAAPSSILHPPSTILPAPLSSNSWLEADLDLPALSAASVGPFGLFRSSAVSLPKLSLSITGNGTNVLTRGEMKFSKPLPFQPELWNIPTNHIHGPLQSFTAIQGLRPWLASFKWWNDLRVGPPPNQVFFWAQQPNAFLTYAAAPLSNAGSAAAAITSFLLEKGNPWLTNNASGQFERSMDANGVECSAGNPLMRPFLQSSPANDFVLAGLARGDVTNQPMPGAPLREIRGQTNLVFFDSEITGPEVQRWLYAGQAFRLIFWKGQLPDHGACVDWLEAAQRWLGPCTTKVTRAGPDRLSVSRTSSTGFNSLELHLLADWLESPRFPQGFHTTLAPGLMRPGEHRKFKAAAPSVSGTNSQRLKR